MDNLKIILEAAIASKSEIEIIYQGGSHPGALRTILPSSLKEGLLKARDLKTRQSKSYKLELITLPEKGVSDDFELSFRDYNSLQDILFLEQKLILHSDLFVLADRFHIRLFKTEKDSVSAAPIFFIAFQKYLRDSQQHKTENLQPWICNGVSYAEVQQAAETFIMALRLYVKKCGK